jgi:hypothetical protein
VTGTVEQRAVKRAMGAQSAVSAAFAEGERASNRESWFSRLCSAQLPTSTPQHTHSSCPGTQAHATVRKHARGGAVGRASEQYCRSKRISSWSSSVLQPRGVPAAQNASESPRRAAPQVQVPYTQSRDNSRWNGIRGDWASREGGQGRAARGKRTQGNEAVVALPELSGRSPLARALHWQAACTMGVRTTRDRSINTPAINAPAQSSAPHALSGVPSALGGSHGEHSRAPQQTRVVHPPRRAMHEIGGRPSRRPRAPSCGMCRSMHTRSFGGAGWDATACRESGAGRTVGIQQTSLSVGT